MNKVEIHTEPNNLRRRRYSLLPVAVALGVVLAIFCFLIANIILFAAVLSGGMRDIG